MRGNYLRAEFRVRSWSAPFSPVKPSGMTPIWRLAFPGALRESKEDGDIKSPLQRQGQDAVLKPAATEVMGHRRGCAAA